MHQEPEELKLKVILLGEQGVGKTSIIDCIHKGPGDRQTIMTTGPEYICERVCIDDVTIKVNVWDTAGQERYRSLNRGFYKGNKGAFIVCDMTDQFEEEKIYYWLNELKEHADKKIKIVFLANKADLANEEECYYEKLKAIADKEGHQVFKTSAKSGLGVQEAFKTLIKSVKDTYFPDYKFNLRSRSTIHLTGVKYNEDESVSVSRRTCC